MLKSELPQVTDCSAACAEVAWPTTRADTKTKKKDFINSPRIFSSLRRQTYQTTSEKGYREYTCAFGHKRNEQAPNPDARNAQVPGGPRGTPLGGVHDLSKVAGLIYNGRIDHHEFYNRKHLSIAALVIDESFVDSLIGESGSAGRLHFTSPNIPRSEVLRYARSVYDNLRSGLMTARDEE